MRIALVAPDCNKSDGQARYVAAESYPKAAQRRREGAVRGSGVLGCGTNTGLRPS